MMQTPKKRLVEAAVLIPVYRDENDRVRIVLVRRGKGGIHGGQLAFPGGKRESRDQSMLAAALREAREEIGLSPERIKILASLRVVETRTTGYLVFPFLARVVPPSKWHRNEREIAEIIAVKLDDLVQSGAESEEIIKFSTWPEPRQTPFYRVGTYRVWGLTYRILHSLIPRLLAGEWTI